MNKLLLFDIDGTLLSTQGVGMRTMERAGVTLFGESFSFAGVTTAGGLDPLLLADAAQRCGIALEDHHHGVFMETYCRLLPEALEAEREKFRVMPGVVDLIEKLKVDERVTLGLLTGNYQRSARIKLAAAGIDPDVFQIYAFGDEAPDRPSLVPLAMQRYADRMGRPIDTRNVILIGDTPKDVHAAMTHGCRVIAVATGPYGTAELLEAGADVALEDLSDPSVVWQMIGE